MSTHAARALVLSLPQTLSQSLPNKHHVCIQMSIFVIMGDFWSMGFVSPVITHNKVSAFMRSAARKCAYSAHKHTHTHTQHTGRQSAACALSATSKSTPVPAAVLKRTREKGGMCFSQFSWQPLTQRSRPCHSPPLAYSSNYSQGQLLFLHSVISFIYFSPFLFPFLIFSQITPLTCVILLILLLNLSVFSFTSHSLEKLLGRSTVPHTHLC